MQLWQHREKPGENVSASPRRTSVYFRRFVVVSYHQTASASPISGNLPLVATEFRSTDVDVRQSI